VSSFNNPHHFFLFAMSNGKKKLGYGMTPEDAFENLRLRLSVEEMRLIDKAQWIKIAQRELQKHVDELG
jgi:hypothetical protein